MATIRKVSRGRRNPPSLGASVVDWLIYVTSTNDSSSSSDISGKSLSKPPSVKRVSFAPKVKYENESEIVFGMPCFLLSLTNEHDQPMTTRIAKVLSKYGRVSVSPWLSTVPSPHVVESSLASYFHDGLCVTMDVSLLFFLHDLILTYMKEKDAVSAASCKSLFQFLYLCFISLIACHFLTDLYVFSFSFRFSISFWFLKSANSDLLDFCETIYYLLLL